MLFSQGSPMDTFPHQTQHHAAVPFAVPLPGSFITDVFNPCFTHIGGDGGSRTRVLWQFSDGINMLFPSLSFFRLAAGPMGRRLCDYTVWISLTQQQSDQISQDSDDVSLPLESVREETSLQLRQRERTLRSLVFFWQKFNEANCHPRHAAVGLLVQSKPWRPQLFISSDTQ